MTLVDHERRAGTTAVRAKQDLILRQAALSLNRRGVAETSLADIARCVGVTRAALYYYFVDQQDLVFQTYRRSCKVLRNHLEGAIAQGGDVRATIADFLGRVTDPAEPEIATLCEVAYLDGDAHRTITDLYEGIVDRLGDALVEGAGRGEIRVCDSRVVAHAILGIAAWIPLQRRWISSAPFSHADLAAAAKDVILNGVAADGAHHVEYTPMPLEKADIPRQSAFDGRELSLAKQEALLAAASWLFNRKGVDATALDEIAARVGVTKKVIYHNIGGKAALLVACYLRSLAFSISLTQRAREESRNALEAACRLVHVQAEARLREDVAPLSGPGGLEFLPEAGLRAVNEAGARLFDAADALMGGVRADPSLRQIDRGPALMIMPGLVEWLPKWLSADTAEQRRHIGGELAAFFALGLRAPAPVWDDHPRNDEGDLI